jgi:hypothetical protein
MVANAALHQQAIDAESVASRTKSSQCAVGSDAAAASFSIATKWRQIIRPARN